MTNLNLQTSIDSTVRQILLQRLTATGGPDLHLGAETKLLDLGMIDSEDLVEIILEVEEHCKCEFNPVEIDLENGLTLSGFISSFVAKR